MNFLPMEVNVKGTTAKYANEFLSLKCSVDMMLLKLFPNFKEITESFSAYNAARKYLWRRGFKPEDNDVHCFIVGDGHTPRTGATFAFRTAWQCISIDPLLNPNFQNQITRLECWSKPVEDITNVPQFKKAVIVAVHSHANLDGAVQKICGTTEFDQLAIISMPCCVPQTIKDWEPEYQYTDYAVWSPMRTVKIWV